MPVYKEEWGISQTVVRDEIIPMVKKIAKAEGVKLIDFYTPMETKSELAPDGIHPNSEGAALIAKIVSENILSVKK